MKSPLHRSLLVVSLVLLPTVSAFITYTFVSSHSSGLSLDNTQAALLSLALMKMLLLGSTGVFPIDMDGVFQRVWGGNRRKRGAGGENSLLYRTPQIEHTPCIRRFLCEIETTVRTSDTYQPAPSSNMEDRHIEEEVDVEASDPLTDLYNEAIHAMFDNKKGGEDSRLAETRAALKAVEGLTGPACEVAYKLCPGRYTPGIAFQAIFDEIGYKVKDEL